MIFEIIYIYVFSLSCLLFILEFSEENLAILDNLGNFYDQFPQKLSNLSPIILLFIYSYHKVSKLVVDTGTITDITKTRSNE